MHDKEVQNDRIDAKEKKKKRKKSSKTPDRVVGGYGVISSIGHCQDQNILHSIIGGFKVILVTKKRCTAMFSFLCCSP